MNIAIPYDPKDGSVFPHTGRTEVFRLYEIIDGKVVKKSLIETNGLSHHDLVLPLLSHDVKVVLASHFGEGMKAAMNGHGISIYSGAKGKADEVIQSYLDGTLKLTEEASCGSHC